MAAPSMKLDPNTGKVSFMGGDPKEDKFDMGQIKAYGLRLLNDEMSNMAKWKKEMKNWQEPANPGGDLTTFRPTEPVFRGVDVSDINTPEDLKMAMERDPDIANKIYDSYARNLAIKHEKGAPPRPKVEIPNEGEDIPMTQSTLDRKIIFQKK